MCFVVDSIGNIIDLQAVIYTAWHLLFSLFDTIRNLLEFCLRFVTEIALLEFLFIPWNLLGFFPISNAT